MIKIPKSISKITFAKTAIRVHNLKTFNEYLKCAFSDCPHFTQNLKQGTQAVMELISKNRAVGYSHSVHYTALFHNQAGYYNSLILQAMDLPSGTKEMR